MKRKETCCILYILYIFERDFTREKKMKNNLYKKNACHAHNYNILEI